ncbi:hypothetical protein G3N92_15885 [Burkholderia sp. Ac-20379]|nr:hypothetical protein [Burkholderia sp. Ac-20379]
MVSAVIPEAVFLKAYDNPDTKTIIVWYLDSKLDNQRELEFSRQLSRPLTRRERESAFPAEREIVLPEDGVKVRIGNMLEPETDVRYETYVALDPVTSATIATSQQIVYMPTMQEPAAVIRSAIKKASFPAQYAAWSAIDRIRYWVGVLYRMRRQTGETGRNEDFAFGPDLLAQMRAVDPGVDAILGAVLAELARMEMMTPDAMRVAFNQRTGASIQ